MSWISGTQSPKEVIRKALEFAHENTAGDGKATVTLNSKQEWDALVSSLEREGYRGARPVNGPSSSWRDDHNVFSAGDFRPAGSKSLDDPLISNGGYTIIDGADGKGERSPQLVEQFPATMELDAKIVEKYRSEAMFRGVEKSGIRPTQLAGPRNGMGPRS